MDQTQAIAIAAAIVPAARKHAMEQIERAIAPIAERLGALEAQLKSQAIVGATKNDSGVLILTLAGGEAIDTGIRDGKDGIDGKDGKDAIGEIGPRGEKGEKGEKGASLASAMINRAGELVFCYETGELQTLGAVIGRDGISPSIEVPDDVAALIEKAIALKGTPLPEPPVMPLVVNVAAPANWKSEKRKTITTRRDKDGLLVADVVEHIE